MPVIFHSLAQVLLVVCIPICLASQGLIVPLLFSLTTLLSNHHILNPKNTSKILLTKKINLSILPYWPYSIIMIEGKNNISRLEMHLNYPLFFFFLEIGIVKLNVIYILAISISTSQKVIKNSEMQGSIQKMKGYSEIQREKVQILRGKRKKQ